MTTAGAFPPSSFFNRKGNPATGDRPNEKHRIYRSLTFRCHRFFLCDFPFILDRTYGGGRPVSSFRRALRFEGDGFMTTLTSTPAATAQQASAVAVLPAEDLDCNAGGDCFYCACPETD
jgi:hypothetical protein